MTMGTSQESYNAEDAARMLHCLGEERVIAAQKNLLSRGVLAKRFRKGPTQPGRALKISEMCGLNFFLPFGKLTKVSS